MEWVRLGSYGSLIEAQLIRGKLSSFGIPCYISGENFFTLHGGIVNVELWVRNEAVKDAMWIMEHAPELPEHCPKCGSNNIQNATITRSGKEGKQYVRMECNDCGNIWRT